MTPMTQLIQERILRLKQEKNACILAHCYQTHDILEVADYVGDSFGLAQNASKTDCSTVIMCGVRFMAEMVKILSPEKRVLLPKAEAGCPMAEQLDPEMLRQLQAAYPDYTTVAYINTTAELKTLCDVCVTSSSAVKIIRNMDAEKILFIPDCNLGDYISKQVPEKQFQLIHGGCPTHVRMTRDDVLRARAAHPNALLLVHPECRPQVTEMADFVGSTTEIMHYAENSDAREFIIGTENSIVEHLSFDCPDKSFYPLAVQLTCMNMKLTTLPDIYRCLLGTGGEQITLPDDIMAGAGRCIRRMVELGG